MAIDRHSLEDTQPDLVALIRRDGTLLSVSGGGDVPELKQSATSTDVAMSTVWPRHVTEVLLQLTKRAIALRSASDTRFEIDGKVFEVRATARGHDRASCLIRRSLEQPKTTGGSARTNTAGRFDRRGFLRRFRESMALATLADKPAAVAVIHIDSVADIAQSFDLTLSDRVANIALQRLEADIGYNDSEPAWYMGQLSHNLLVLVFESADREAVESCLGRVCASLRRPVQAADLTFHLSPFAGAAILGRDANSAKMLLDCARSAAGEARRGHSAKVHFFTDTLRLKALTRLDMARELRDAINNGEIALRYSPRVSLHNGEVTAWVGYLRWQHPLRGDVPPAEFLPIAETTGQSEILSRAALKLLQQDYQSVAADLPANIRFSFGGLRHHLLSDNFLEDIANLLDSGSLPADRLELRVSEQACLIREPTVFSPLVDRGVQIVVDEVGRDAVIMRRLAAAPIWGLQLDRAWAVAVQSDLIARKLCRATIAMAQAFDLTPIATGIDDESQCDELRQMGCSHGQGDLFSSLALPASLNARKSDNNRAVAPSLSSLLQSDGI